MLLPGYRRFRYATASPIHPFLQPPLLMWDGLLGVVHYRDERWIFFVHMVSRQSAYSYSCSINNVFRMVMPILDSAKFLRCCKKYEGLSISLGFAAGASLRQWFSDTSMNPGYFVKQRCDVHRPLRCERSEAMGLPHPIYTNTYLILMWG